MAAFPDDPARQVDLYRYDLNVAQVRVWLAAAEARGASDDGHILSWARAGLARLDADPEGDVKVWRPSVENWNRLHELSGMA